MIDDMVRCTSVINKLQMFGIQKKQECDLARDDGVLDRYVSYIFYFRYSGRSLSFE